MRVAQALMMLLGVLAVLMSAAAPAARAEASSTPPCHEATMRHDGAGAPSPASGKAMKAMDCCVASVTASALLPPDVSRVTAPRPTVVAAPAALPAGEQPAPEPYPPRPTFL